MIFDDALAHNQFSSDAYISEQRARSILCLPLLNQGKLIAVLYLENNLSPHVFTPARIAVLKLLASQAAISLENAHLYRDLEERETKFRRLVDELNIIGIFVWTLAGRIVEANEAFLRLLGYDRDDLVSGRINWTDCTPNEWRVDDERALAELKAIGTVQPYEKDISVKMATGCQCHRQCRFEERRDQGVAFVLDLTERKQAEKETRESQRRIARCRPNWHTRTAWRQWDSYPYRLYTKSSAYGSGSS